MNNILAYYFKLSFRIYLRTMERYKQNPLVMSLALAGGFFFGFRALFRNFSYAPYVLLGFQLFVLILLSAQERNTFLYLTYKQKQYRLLRILENVLVSLPFFLFLLYYKHFVLAGMSLIIPILGVFIRVGKFRLTMVIPSPFSQRPYEFTTGWRRTWLIFIGLYALFFYALGKGNLFLMLACLYGVYLICMTFYSQMPLVFYVWIYNKSAKDFLRYKMLMAVRYSLFLTAPLLIALLSCHFSDLWLILLILGVGIMHLLLAIVYSYVNFPIYSTMSQNVQFAAALILPPLWFAAFPNLYFQAVRRLKSVLVC